MTAHEAMIQIKTAIQACGSYPLQRESAVQLDAAIEDTIRQLLASLDN